jgi:hypothetical protein
VSPAVERASAEARPAPRFPPAIGRRHDCARAGEGGSRAPIPPLQNGEDYFWSITTALVVQAYQ